MEKTLGRKKGTPGRNAMVRPAGTEAKAGISAVSSTSTTPRPARALTLSNGKPKAIPPKPKKINNVNQIETVFVQPSNKQLIRAGILPESTEKRKHIPKRVPVIKRKPAVKGPILKKTAVASTSTVQATTSKVQESVQEDRNETQEPQVVVVESTRAEEKELDNEKVEDIEISTKENGTHDGNDNNVIVTVETSIEKDLKGYPGERRESPSVVKNPVVKKQEITEFLPTPKSKNGRDLSEMLVHKLPDRSRSTPRKIRRNSHANCIPKSNWGTPETNVVRSNYSHNMVAKRAVNKANVLKKNVVQMLQKDVINKMKDGINKPALSPGVIFRETEQYQEKIEETYTITSVKNLISRFENIVDKTSQSGKNPKVTVPITRKFFKRTIINETLDLEEEHDENTAEEAATKNSSDYEKETTEEKNLSVTNEPIDNKELQPQPSNSFKSTIVVEVKQASINNEELNSEIQSDNLCVGEPSVIDVEGPELENQAFLNELPSTVTVRKPRNAKNVFINEINFGTDIPKTNRSPLKENTNSNNDVENKFIRNINVNNNIENKRSSLASLFKDVADMSDAPIPFEEYKKIFYKRTSM